MVFVEQFSYLDLIAFYLKVYALKHLSFLLKIARNYVTKTTFSLKYLVVLADFF